MADEWFYADGGERRGPVTFEALVRLAREGRVAAGTLVWRDGLAGWTAAEAVPGLLPASESAAAPPPLPSAAAPGRGVLGGIGARISAVSDLPTISSMPVGRILVGGLQRATRTEDIEEELIVGRG